MNKERKQTNPFHHPKYGPQNLSKSSTQTSSRSQPSHTTSTSTPSCFWMTTPPRLGPPTCAQKMLHSQQQRSSSLWWKPSIKQTSSNGCLMPEESTSQRVSSNSSKTKGYVYHKASLMCINKMEGLRAERLIRTLTEKAETLRFQACLPQSWWEFALDYATHIYN